MPRYIDAEQFRGKHDVAEINGKLCSVIPYADIVNAPTADVVPRAEVEELIYKLECLLCHATGGLLSKHTYDLHTMERVVTDYINDAYAVGADDGYKNCAREIFAEINAIKKEYASGDIDGNELYVRLYMLEKKYTEGE